MVKCWRNINFEEIDTESLTAKTTNFDYCEEYLRSTLKQNFVMAVLRKANFHLVDIYKLIINQQCKKRSRKKTDSNFDFFQVAMCLGFQKKEYYLVHLIQLYLHQRT